MSKFLSVQSQDGRAVTVDALQNAIIYQTSAPTNGVLGYSTGCLWINKSGTAGSILYINQGTTTSSTWFAIA